MTRIDTKLKEFSNIFYFILRSTGFDISNFSNTRIMLLLYLTCLESIKISDDNLFRYFDNFIAYPNGPFEIDVYNSFDIIPGFIYDSECFKSISSGYTFSPSKIIMKSIDLLILDLPDSNKDFLIDLVHKLPTWKDGYLYGKFRKMILSKENILEDYYMFKELI